MSFELGTICLQLITILVALVAGFRGSKFMFGFVITFGIYAYFNLSSYYKWNYVLPIPYSTEILLFIAAVCATFSVWKSYKY